MRGQNVQKEKRRQVTTINRKKLQLDKTSKRKTVDWKITLNVKKLSKTNGVSEKNVNENKTLNGENSR
jgi:hypothetical protein